jgi:hypothetical protein
MVTGNRAICSQIAASRPFRTSGSAKDWTPVHRQAHPRSRNWSHEQRNGNTRASLLFGSRWSAVRRSRAGVPVLCRPLAALLDAAAGVPGLRRGAVGGRDPPGRARAARLSPRPTGRSMGGIRDRADRAWSARSRLSARSRRFPPTSPTPRAPPPRARRHDGGSTRSCAPFHLGSSRAQKSERRSGRRSPGRGR